MIKLTKKTIQPNQIVVVISATYTLPTMKNSSWYEPQTKLYGYVDIGALGSITQEIEVGEKLKIINYNPTLRSVKYMRFIDGKEYSSYLGEFTTFVRLTVN